MTDEGPALEPLLVPAHAQAWMVLPAQPAQALLEPAQRQELVQVPQPQLAARAVAPPAHQPAAQPMPSQQSPTTHPQGAQLVQAFEARGRAPAR